MRSEYVYLSQLLSEIILTKVLILASLEDFYFATQCVQSRFPSTFFLFCFFFFSFLVRTQVIIII